MEVDVSQTTEAGTPAPARKRRYSTFPEPVPVVESTVEKKKKLDDKPEEMIPNQEISKDDKNELIKSAEAEIEEIIKNAETSKQIIKDNVPEEKDKPISLEEQEVHRVTPIKLVALPRANKQTPKIFTTAKVSKSNLSSPAAPGTPVDEEKSLNTSSSKRSKVSKADRFVMLTEQKDSKSKSSRRNSRNNKSLTSTPKHEKTDKTTNNKSEDNKTSDSGSDASTSKEKLAKKKDDGDKSLLKKDTDTSKSVKDEKKTKKTEDDISLAAIARENKNPASGLPTISNVVSLSTTAVKTSTTNTKNITNSKNTAPKTIEITIEANSDSSIFTPTSMGNVGNMKEAVFKLQKLRSETTSEPFVGRVGVKAFARMTSPDVNDDVEVKTEPIDLDEMDENRQTEKMDLMNACKLQPVSQAQNLRDVRINKVVITPTVMVRKPAKVPEARPRAKKTFPQPKRPEGGELNGKNSMVYIPIQPPMTQPPAKPTKPGPIGITMPANVTAGPRLSAPVLSSK